MPEQESEALKYTKAVYAHVEHWYETADRKAQIVLALDGALLSFMTSQAFSKAEELRIIIDCGTAITATLLAIMATLLAASILSAIACLHPRLHSARGATEEILQVEKEKSSTDEHVPPRLGWFFGHLAQLNQERVAHHLQAVDDAFATEALAHEAAKFSRNVYQKHQWADRAFVFAGSSLLFLLLATASYWWQLETCQSICLNAN